MTLTTATSESGVVLSAAAPNGLPVGGSSAGLSTTGTRLKAVFTGLDANTSYYVSLAPVLDYSTPAPFAGTAGDATQTPWAILQATGTAGTAVIETDAFLAAIPVANANSAVPIAKVTQSAAGDGQATWEVTNTAPGAPATFTFAVYAEFNNAANPPVVGNVANVNLGYAPTTDSSGAASTNLPRFVALGATAVNFFKVLKGGTVLMFPYVTNIGTYETGMSIANTSQDPFSTPPTSGACSIYFYGDNQPASAITLTDGAGNSNVLPGTVIANTTSGLGLVNFNGYAIAVCNFQFAHGFAFLQNGTQTLGMGYLPLVVDTSLNPFNQRGAAIPGESLRP